MALVFMFLVLFTNILVSKGQKEPFDSQTEFPTTTGNPSYAFSYGVTDVHTGDVKAAWEEKEGDTVKGHYSVLEPDGSMRTVDYSVSPESGFQAVVNNDGDKVVEVDGSSIGRSEKMLRNYEKFYDFSEQGDLESMPSERKRVKYPFDSALNAKKRSKYPYDMDSSEFSHSITIKHPREGSGESESHSHFGLDIDPNCKTKHKKAPTNNLYSSIVEFDPRKPNDLKYPFLSPESYKDEKYEASNIDYERYVSPYGNKLPKFDPSPSDYEKLLNPYVGSKLPSIDDYSLKPSSSKYKYPYIPDIPPEHYYPDEIPSRPKKKYRPPKHSEYSYPSEDIEDDYVPKKKKKTPSRLVEQFDYRPELDEEFDRPRYPNDFEDDEEEEERPHRPRKRPQKEIVKKVVKKRKPGFNLLDILDI